MNKIVYFNNLWCRFFNDKWLLKVKIYEKDFVCDSWILICIGSGVIMFLIFWKIIIYYKMYDYNIVIILVVYNELIKIVYLFIFM